MYLVMKQIKNRKKDMQMPIKAYINVEDAFNFLDAFAKESAWSYIYERSWRGHSNLSGRRYYRDLKNGGREFIFVKYIQLHY